MDYKESDFIEDESQREIDEDFIANDVKFSQAVVSGNDWTTETLL